MPARGTTNRIPNIQYMDVAGSEMKQYILACAWDIARLWLVAGGLLVIGSVHVGEPRQAASLVGGGRSPCY